MAHFLRTSLVLAACLALAPALSPRPTRVHAQETSLSVREVALSTAVENGQPVNPKTSFGRSEGRLYVTVHMLNPARTEAEVTVLLRQAGGANRARISLNIPARPRYRTLARFSTNQAPGSYEAVVLGPDGSELNVTTLTITE